MRAEDLAETHFLGQFIPVHYHHNMLLDEDRMTGFRRAIEHAVFPGARVLELGGGTGVLSCFAANAGAGKVWCVELNPDLVDEANRFLPLNPRAREVVEVVYGDAFDYLPPEPVDVVVCEMIHTGMLREKQVQVIEAFKARYRERFGPRLPVFIPDAVLMAVQPLDQRFEFHGFNAPIVMFQKPEVLAPGSVELAEPQLYAVLDFSEPTSGEFAWEGVFHMTRDGTVNALRFITKNVLAILGDRGATVDWLNDYLVLPLEVPSQVRAGESVRISFQYSAGASLRSLQERMSATVLTGQTVPG